MFTQFKNFINNNNNNNNNDSCESYPELIKKVAALSSNSSAQSKLRSKNLRAMQVAWEDTSRYQGSSIGSNITDLTLKVNSYRLPIIRGENFADCTVDLEFDKLPKLVVGNETGSALTKVTLKEYLEKFEKYCGVPSCEPTNLYNARDAHVLTSAQACVLPTDNGKVEFAVDLYNYQSGSEPAVLIIMATAYGTSTQVVSGGNTVLYFNANAMSRLFKAERLTEYRISQGRPAEGPMTSEEKALNGIYIFQVPLKVEQRFKYNYYGSNISSMVPEVYCCKSSATSTPKIFYDKSYSMDDDDEGSDGDMSCSFDGGFEEKTSLNIMYEKAAPKSSSRANTRGMERAILTVGEEKGPFKGIKKSSGGIHKLVRDADKPVRLTVQFYLCSDTDNISDSNVEDISSQIRHIYDQGLNEGSLVVNHPVAKPGLNSEATVGRPTATTNTYTPVYLNNNIL